MGQIELRHCRLLRGAEKAELYEKVDYIRQILGISLDDYPIDPYMCISEISDFLIVENAHFSDSKLGGFTIRSYDAKRPSVIIINTHCHETDRNFALAHELIHFFCHDSAHDGYYAAHNEKQANEGAAELLLPYKLFLPDLYAGLEYYDNDLEVTLANMAKAYHVAPEVVSYRYANLAAEREQYSAGIPIGQIKLMTGHRHRRGAKDER